LISDNKNNNKLRALSVIVRVDKNCLHTGDKEIITIRLVDKHATNAVSAATVSCRLSSPSGPFKKLLITHGQLVMETRLGNIK